MAKDDKSDLPSTTNSESPSSHQKPNSTPKQADKSDKVMFVNRTRRVIELDFGRDKEVRVEPLERFSLKREYLTHPAFLAERDNFSEIPQSV